MPWYRNNVSIAIPSYCVCWRYISIWTNFIIYCYIFRFCNSISSTINISIYNWIIFYCYICITFNSCKWPSTIDVPIYCTIFCTNCAIVYNNIYITFNNCKREIRICVVSLKYQTVWSVTCPICAFIYSNTYILSIFLNKWKTTCRFTPAPVCIVISIAWIFDTIKKIIIWHKFFILPISITLHCTFS